MRAWWVIINRWRKRSKRSRRIIIVRSKILRNSYNFTTLQITQLQKVRRLLLLSKAIYHSWTPTKSLKAFKWRSTNWISASSNPTKISLYNTKTRVSTAQMNNSKKNLRITLSWIKCTSNTFLRQAEITIKRVSSHLCILRWIRIRISRLCIIRRRGQIHCFCHLISLLRYQLKKYWRIILMQTLFHRSKQVIDFTYYANQES